MTTTHVSTSIRIASRASRLVLTCLISAAVLSAFAVSPHGASAKPMPDVQEQVIAQSAKNAIAVFNFDSALSNADRSDLFDAYIADIAKQAAIFLGLDERTLQQAWLATDLTRKRALIKGLTQLGVPYKYGASIEDVAFDCSGLTAFAWAEAGIELPRGSTAQFARATPVKLEDAQPGDLVWRPGHIGIYLGVQGAVLQTPYSGRSVELQLMNERIASWVKYANPQK